MIFPAAIAAPQPPNIILFMVDDMGWADAGFNGGPLRATPNLDRLAADGLILNHFYAAAPVCSPTRASCLTGRHPSRQGIGGANSGSLRASEITIQQRLKQAGYRTGHFGKWHLGTMTKILRDSNRGGQPQNDRHYAPPWDRGFDVCFSTEAKTPTWDPMLQKTATEGAHRWWIPVKAGEKGTRYGTRYWTGPGRPVMKPLTGSDTKHIADHAIRFIETSRQPFFSVIWTHGPHRPVVASQELRERFPDMNEHEQSYFGSIADIDDQLGRIIQTLKETHNYSRTLIWFCSDNGPEGTADKEDENYGPGSAGVFRGRKRSLYEGGVRVPGVISYPALIESGARSSLPSVTSDILPTIFDLLGFSQPSRPIDGVSLLPLMSGEDMAHRPPIGSQSGKQASWVEGKWKLITQDGGETWELYDLSSDPSEQSNLIEGNESRAQQMRISLDEWRKSCTVSAAQGR